MRDRIANALQAAGAVSLSAGAALVSTSLGLAVAGACMIVGGFLYGLVGRKGA